MNEDIVRKTKIVLILILTFPLYSSNSFSLFENLTSNSQDTRTTDWILGLQDNDLNNTQWYYDHLNNNDRKMIRQALDWAIPREYIINNIMDGFAIPSLTYLSPYSSPALSNGPKPRTYNLTEAGNLLTKVFGYRFNQFTNNPETVYDETKPYFKLTLLVPLNNPKRIDYANEIRLAWQKIGIKVDQRNYNWVDFYTSLSGGKKDFDHGGFDAFLIGFNHWTHLLWLAQTYRGLNTTLENYINTIIGFNWEPNVTIRNEILLKYQQWVYDNVPDLILFRYLTLNAKNKNLLGFNPFTQFNYENWTYAGKNSIQIAIDTYWALGTLNPIFNYVNQLDIYGGEDLDTRLATGPLFRGMFFSTTEENDTTFTKWNTYPYFANWYNTSVDGKTWFVNLKEGLKWHDGVDLNTSDVEFTFNSFLHNSTPINGAGEYQFFIKSLTVLNSTLIKFEFNNTWMIKETFLSTTILPKHILENIPMNEWASDATNTGINGGVIGNGPYTFVNKSSDESSINLQRWDYWNDSYNSLIKYNKMGETIPGVNVPSIDNIELKIYDNKTDIVNGLNNNSIDIKLGRFIPVTDHSIINDISDPIEPIIYPSSSTQELDFNLFSPVWGYFPADPFEMYPETPTTSSSTSMRSSSSIPTSDINIISILSGLGVIAIISVYSRRKKLL